METVELKATVDQIGRSFEEFKAAHEKSKKDGDVLVEEKMQRLTDDITKKYEAAQRAIDDFGARLSRPNPPADHETEKRERQDAGEFTRACMVIQKQWKDDQDSEPQVDLSAFRVFTKAFRRYLRKGDRILGAEETKALSVGSDPDGGYTVMPQMSSRTITKIFESSPLRDLATVETIGSDELKLPVDIDEASVGWVGETQARPETGTPKFNEKSIPAHEQYAKPKATQKMLEDSAVDVERWLSNKVGDKFGRNEATAFVTGDGIAKPRGFMSYAAGTSWGQIQQVVTGSAAAFTYPGIVDLIYSLKENYHANATFLTRRENVAGIMKLEDTEGHLIFMPVGPQGFNNMPLLGYRLRFAADIAATGANALAMAFGDFREGYTVVDRLGISMLRDPFSSKPYVEFYFRRRVGGDVTNYEAIKIQKCST